MHPKGVERPPYAHPSHHALPATPPLKTLMTLHAERLTRRASVRLLITLIERSGAGGRYAGNIGGSLGDSGHQVAIPVPSHNWGIS